MRNFAHTGKRNHLRDRDWILHVGRYAGLNHVCAAFCDGRLRGLGVARGKISRFPIDLRRRPYSTLALRYRAWWLNWNMHPSSQGSAEIDLTICIFVRNAFLRLSMKSWWREDLCFTGMAADYLPRISSEYCSYPFTYLGGLYHGCAENIENVTAPCERWGCFQVNYSAAVCAANMSKTPLSLLGVSGDCRYCFYSRGRKSGFSPRRKKKN